MPILTALLIVGLILRVSFSTEVTFRMSSFFLAALSAAVDSGRLCTTKFNSIFSLSFCLLNKEVVNEATDSVDIGWLFVILDSCLGAPVSSGDFVRMLSTALEFFSMAEFNGLTNVSFRTPQMIVIIILSKLTHEKKATSVSTISVGTVTF